MIKDIENTELEEINKSDNWNSRDSCAYPRVTSLRYYEKVFIDVATKSFHIFPFSESTLTCHYHHVFIIIRWQMTSAKFV